MKILVVFVLAVLHCSLAEGGFVSKCDLRDQLVKTIGNLTVKAKQKLTEDNFVAKFVCHAQLASHFNTRAVKELVSGVFEGHLNPFWPHTQKRRNSKELSFPTQPKPFNHNPPLKESTSTNSKPSTPPIRGRRAPQDAAETGTLYGIFQLSNRLVCSDGSTPSPTICGIACRELVDDDIRDDIRCLLKIFTIVGDGGLGADDQDELNRMIRRILEPQCSVVKPSVYFAKCPSP